ncbi:MAG: GntR family transcriptional regulator [Mycetocola sp.]
MTPDLIADHLARDIRTGTFAAGAPLVQEDIAKRFSVSRNPVREALRLLEARGLITIRGGDGARVRVLSDDDLTELYSLRITLEPTIAEFVIDGCTARSLTKLDQLAARMEQEKDVNAWLDQNFEFHEALYALAERPRTTEILSALLSAAQPYSRRNIEDLGGRTQADADHRTIIDAIRAGDTTLLATTLAAHLSAAEHRLESDSTRDR